MDNIALTFGKRIRSIRTGKNISQEKLAELCGLHPTYIGQIERGEKSPTIDSIYKIAEGFGMSMEELFANIGKSSDNGKSDYANKIFDVALSLNEEKRKELYRLILKIIEF